MARPMVATQHKTELRLAINRLGRIVVGDRASRKLLDTVIEQLRRLRGERQ